MNTVQNNKDNNDSAKPDYPTVELAPKPISGKGVAQSITVPFEPGFINVPIGLAIFGQSNDHYGASQVDVLMSALKAYEEQVASWHTDKETTLGLIGELKESVLAAMYNRLSDSATILHSQKYQLPDAALRSSK